MDFSYLLMDFSHLLMDFSHFFQVPIDVETYEYFSVHSKGSEGVLVLVQHYRDIPLMRKESFVLGPGQGKFVMPSPIKVTALERPSGNIPQKEAPDVV